MYVLCMKQRLWELKKITIPIPFPFPDQDQNHDQHLMTLFTLSDLLPLPKPANLSSSNVTLKPTNPNLHHRPRQRRQHPNHAFSAQHHNHRICDDNNVRRQCHSVDDVPAMARSFTTTVNRTTTSTSFLHSNSSYGVAKPPAIKRHLYCTLEELCFGFEGRFEKPGTITADVVFVVSEIMHPLFIRREDDLELEVEISLIDALTGCILSIPLLGREMMSLTIDEVVHPGYEMIIEGEGMPNHNGTRRNLVIKFLVKFPPELTENQRSEAADILQQACYN